MLSDRVHALHTKLSRFSPQYLLLGSRAGKAFCLWSWRATAVLGLMQLGHYSKHLTFCWKACLWLPVYKDSSHFWHLNLQHTIRSLSLFVSIMVKFYWSLFFTNTFVTLALAYRNNQHVGLNTKHLFSQLSRLSITFTKLIPTPCLWTLSHIFCDIKCVQLVQCPMFTFITPFYDFFRTACLVHCSFVL